MTISWQERKRDDGEIFWRDGTGNTWSFSVYESEGCTPECWWVSRKPLDGRRLVHGVDGHEAIREVGSLAEALAVAGEWEEAER
jgi:hypothetical protein